MAGNKPSKRKVSSSTPVERSGLDILSNRRLGVTTEVIRLHTSVVKQLNCIIDGSGNFEDWMAVVHRIYVGSIAAYEYFKHNPPLNQVMNTAHMATSIIMLRVHTGGQFGVLVAELDSIVEALDYTDQMMRMLNPKEIAHIHNKTANWLDEIVTNNMLAYPDEALTPQQRSKFMVRRLMKEKEEVEKQPKLMAVA